MIGRPTVVGSIVLAALTLSALTGCEQVRTQKEELARLKTIVAKTQEENRALMEQVERLESERVALQAQLAAKDRKIAVLQDGVRRLQEISKLGRKEQQQLEILAERLGGKLVGNRLELPGDFFFGSGKFALRDEAKSAIGELVDILKGSLDRGDELVLLIVGHTDSDPVKNPRLKRLGIRDNRHLSVRRAISVLDALKESGYPERLMYPTGWGELYRLDTSGTSEGKALNRRVDILIDPAASGLFTISAITDVMPAGAAAGTGEGPVTAGE